MAKPPSLAKQQAQAKRAKVKGTLGLSLREVRFCVLYAENDNATQSYREAGFPIHPSESTWVSACRVLRKVKVQEKIWDLREAGAVAAGVTVAGIARGLNRSAEKDLRQLYDEKGRIKLPHEWPDDLAGVIEGVESEEIFETVTDTDEDGKKTRRKELVGYVRKVKTTNRTEAQKVLAQWKRMIGQDASAANGSPAPLVIIPGPAVIAPPPDEPEESADGG